MEEPQTETSPDIVSQPSAMRGVFFGPDGLRAGWSAGLFLVCIALFAGVATGIAHLIHPPHAGSRQGGAIMPLSAMAGEFVMFVIVLAATAVMARIENRHVTSYGFGGEKRLPLFLAGAFWGFAFNSALVGLLYLAHGIRFTGYDPSVSRDLKYAVLWGVVMLLVACFEESLLRGYLQWTLARGIGFWWGALLLSIAFGALHTRNRGESPIGIFAAGAIGLVFCLSIWYTKSLWWAIGAHATWDWAESYFYGTANSGMVAQGHLFSTAPLGRLMVSGGPTGPEGSWLVLPVILLIALVIYLTLRPRSTAIDGMATGAAPR